MHDVAGADIDPRDSAEVANAVAQWATVRFGGAVDVVGIPRAIVGGLDSYVHFVDFTGTQLPAEWRQPLVVRVLPSPNRLAQAEREAAVQTWCADNGYDAPRVLAVMKPDELIGLPVQVMERAAGSVMASKMTSRPWKTRALVDGLAALAVRLHSMPTAGWPGPDEPQAAVDQRLSLPRRVVAALDIPELANGLAQAETLAATSVSGERVVCHGDFHPLNVIIDGGEASVIDWTDAALGPREADVSRTALLFSVAVIAAKNSTERAVLARVGPRMARRYVHTYERHAPLDHALMKRWDVFHALHGWAQLEMLHAGGFEGESSSSPDAVAAGVRVLVRQRFEAALAAAI